jgi:hypothetical protein
MGSALPVEHLSYDDLRRAAERFLKEFHPRRAIPVPIEEIIDLQFKVDVIPVPGLHDVCEIDAFITSDLSAIYVDDFVYQHRSNRYRFSLAHELSHAILHQELFRALKFSTIKEWVATMPTIPEDEYGWIEWQAYALAGLILAPQPELKQRFGRAVARAAKAGLSLSDATDPARAAIAGYLAREFAVSAEVIEKRLAKDGLWDEVG